MAGGEFGGNGVYRETSHSVYCEWGRGQFDVPVVILGETLPFIIPEPHACVGRRMNDHFDREILPKCMQAAHRVLENGREFGHFRRQCFLEAMPVGEWNDPGFVGTSRSIRAIDDEAARVV